MREVTWVDTTALRRWLLRRAPLLAVVALILLLHLPVYQSAFGGYHAYNEGFYSNGARQQATQPVWKTILRPVDSNNLPLFSWVLTLLVRLFGSGEALLRLPTLLAALASVFLVGLVAEELVGSRAAVPSALFLGLMPVHLIVGTNVQPDMMMLALSLGGVLAYLRAYRSDERTFRVLSGVLFGLAVLTKLNAVLFPVAIVIWETARRRRLDWLARPSTRAWVAWGVGLPLGWLVAQLLASGGRIFNSQTTLAETAVAPQLSTVQYLLVEMVWQFGPPLALISLAGGIIALAESRKRLNLAFCLFGLSLGFFLVYHFHSYYLLPAAPAAAILAGSVFEDLPLGPKRWAWIAISVAVALPFTLSFYNYKIPQSTVRRGAAWIQSRGGPVTTVVLPRPVYDNSSEVFRYYLPEASVTSSWPADPGRAPQFVVYCLTDTSALPSASYVQERQTYMEPVVAGYAIWGKLVSMHQFRIVSVRATWQEPYRLLGLAQALGLDFGVVDLRLLTPQQAAAFRARWLAQDDF